MGSVVLDKFWVLVFLCIPNAVLPTRRLLPMLQPGSAADDIVDAVRTNQVTVTLPGAVRYLLPLKRQVSCPR